MDHNLLQEYIAGDANAAEKEIVITWLNADKENMKTFISLRKIYDFSVWHESDKISATKRKSRKLSIEFLKIAAVFAFALVCTFLISKNRNSNENSVCQKLYVPSGQRAEITLSDGTKVFLNAKSTLTFPSQFTSDNREVTLDGEGYFDVACNESKPFIVKTKKYDIKVLGTEFNVIAYNEWDMFETALIKGSVELSSKNQYEKVHLTPNHKVNHVNNKLVYSQIENHSYFLWKNGLICFDDETVENIFKKIQLYYDIKIEVQNKSILQYRYSGKFRTKDGVEHVLKVLQLKHKFSYIRNDEQNTLLIK